MREWLKGLPSREDRRLIGYDIETVEFGWPIGMPVCRPLEDGIYEVRTNLPQNRIARFLFYIDKLGRMVPVAWFHQEIQTDTARGVEVGAHQQEEAGERTVMKKVQRVPDHSGSTFESFLEEEGIREEVEAVAVKRILAWQLLQEMRQQKKTKQAMARELHTSRSQLDRLLDPTNVSVSLGTMTRAAEVLGKSLVIRIRDRTASHGPSAETGLRRQPKMSRP